MDPSTRIVNYLGWLSMSRLVLDAGAKVLDEWEGNELLAIELPEDPGHCLVALKLRCPSTTAVYVIRVRPDQMTVQGALAWSFGLDKPTSWFVFSSQDTHTERGGERRRRRCRTRLF